MKRLKIPFRKLENNEVGYEAYLERDCVKHFKTKRGMMDFLNDFEKTINDNTRLLSSLFLKAQHLYAIHYHQLDAQCCRFIAERISFFAVQYNYIFHGYGEHVSFIKIRVCFDVIEDVLLRLKVFAQRHKQTSLQYELNSCLKSWQLLLDDHNKQLESLDIDIAYRKKEPLKVIKTVQHENIEIKNIS